MAACIFCRGFHGVHEAGCPFITPVENRTSGLTEEEYKLFDQRAQQWLDEEDASKPDMTITMVKAVMIGQMKLIRDLLLPPPDSKDPSITSMRAMSQLATEGEKFLSSLQKAMMAASNTRVSYTPQDEPGSGESDDDLDDALDGIADEDLPDVPIPSASLKPKLLPPAKPTFKKAKTAKKKGK